MEVTEKQETSALTKGAETPPSNDGSSKGDLVDLTEDEYRLAKLGYKQGEEQSRNYRRLTS